MSTVVIKPDSVSGMVTVDGVTRMHTFTTRDASGWWQVSEGLRIAAKALDPDGLGLPYAHDDDNSFSRNAILHWYGVKPPADDEDVHRVRHELSQTDWSVLTPDKKAELKGRVETARKSIDAVDERTNLAHILTARVADKPDSDPLSLGDLHVPVGSTSVLTRNSAGEVPIGDALKAHGLELPKTVGELRNTLRWLTAALPPPPPYGNYSGGLVRTWSPGALSDADKASLVELNDHADPNQASAAKVMGLLDKGDLLKLKPDAMRVLADRVLDRVLGDEFALFLGHTLAHNQHFLGASGTEQLSDEERKQWVIAAIKLQVDPDAPGRPGVVAGYDLYQPSNNAKSIPEVREALEAHLKKNPLLDPRAAPLVAHLLLASAAPEFLVRDIPPTLMIGSEGWADFRLGVAMAEHLGGAGCSRSMSYKEVMAFSRLEPRTPEEAALMANYGVNIMLDWGVMQGIYPKPADGQYTAQHYEQAAKAFGEQREQLIKALEVFNTPLPTREDVAIANLQKAFPDLSVDQLKAMRVGIADQSKLTNVTRGNPPTRPLVETYMSGDLVKDRWMLLAPGEQLPQPPKTNTPFGFNLPLTKTQQDDIGKNVQALNAKIATLPDVQDQTTAGVDSYLDNLKNALGTTTRQLIANLPLEDRKALELGSIELFALRQEVDGVPVVEQTPGQVEERRGRKGTLIRSEYQGKIRYFEVFPDKAQLIKREDLPDQLHLGGDLQDRPKAYGVWAPSVTKVQKGREEPFDFAAYSSHTWARHGEKSPGIIIEKLGETLPAAPHSAEHDAPDYVPHSSSSARTHSIIDGIMQGNFVHHRDSIVKAAQGKLPLEEHREILAENQRILLGLVPYVGAIADLVDGNIVDGTRGLIIDTVGAFLGGAGSAAKSFTNATKVVAPFGVKAFRVLESGVQVLSAFLNPFDSSADLLAAGFKGVFAAPRLLARTPSKYLVSSLPGLEEKLRAYLNVRRGDVSQKANPDSDEKSLQPNGENHSVPVRALQVGGNWYAIHPKSGLPFGTPLDGFTPLATSTE